MKRGDLALQVIYLDANCMEAYFTPKSQYHDVTDLIHYCRNQQMLWQGGPCANIHLTATPSRKLSKSVARVDFELNFRSSALSTTITSMHVGLTRKRRRRRRSADPSRTSLIAMGKRLTPLLIVAAFALAVDFASAVFGIGDKRFTYEGLINAGGLGLDDVDGQVVAFGDFDGDSYVDAFVLSRDRKRIDVRLWDHNNFRFSGPQEGAQQLSITMPQSLTVSNVVPADFNFDGKLDVLVMMFDETPPEPLKNLALRHGIWLANLEGGLGECQDLHGDGSDCCVICCAVGNF